MKDIIIKYVRKSELNYKKSYFLYVIIFFAYSDGLNMNKYYTIIDSLNDIYYLLKFHKYRYNNEQVVIFFND